MKMKIRDMTIDQIIDFCSKRKRKDHLCSCDECPFLDGSGPECMFWEYGFNLEAVNREVDVDEDGLTPNDIYNSFQEEFPEMLKGIIGWEYDSDLIGKKRIAIRIRRDPLTEERWIYDYEKNDMNREVCNK